MIGQMKKRIESILGKLPYPRMDVVNVNWESIGRKLATVFVWLLIVLIVLFVLNEIYGWRMIPSTRAIASGLGALGTLLLAWVTLRTLRQNEDLITQQRSRLENQEARIRPKLRRIGQFSVKESRENQLVIELENVGSGKAVNIQLVPDLYVLDDWPYEPISEYSQDHEIPTVESYSKALVTSEKNPLNYTHRGAVLEGDGSNSFALRPDYRNTDVSTFDPDYDPSEEPRLLVFYRLIEFLKESDAEHLGFLFRVKYEDIFGNVYTEEFYGPRFDIKNVNSLSDALGRAFWHLEADRRYYENIEGDE